MFKNGKRNWSSQTWPPTTRLTFVISRSSSCQAVIEIDRYSDQRETEYRTITRPAQLLFFILFYAEINWATEHNCSLLAATHCEVELDQWQWFASLSEDWRRMKTGRRLFSSTVHRDNNIYMCSALGNALSPAFDSKDRQNQSFY